MSPKRQQHTGKLKLGKCDQDYTRHTISREGQAIWNESTIWREGQEMRQWVAKTSRHWEWNYGMDYSTQRILGWSRGTCDFVAASSMAAGFHKMAARFHGDAARGHLQLKGLDFFNLQLSRIYEGEIEWYSRWTLDFIAVLTAVSLTMLRSCYLSNHSLDLCFRTLLIIKCIRLWPKVTVLCIALNLFIRLTLELIAVPKVAISLHFSVKIHEIATEGRNLMYCYHSQKLRFISFTVLWQVIFNGDINGD